MRPPCSRGFSPRGFTLIVAGVMSGTSADGIDVALVRIEGHGVRSRIELLAHHQVAYAPRLRRAILDIMNATASVADLSRLNFLLGELYADAVETAQRRSGLQCELVGCHGQTIYHQGEPTAFIGRKIACTWQIGEGAVIASRLGVPVVSDFRPADMGAGGKGAPLVPYLDYVLFRHRRFGRIVQNIGGIANLTAIPAGAELKDVIAFDTGPGNMVIDGVAQQLFGVSFDRGGKLAGKGNPIESVLKVLLRGQFFHKRPPKTAGREQFGREFVAKFLRLCGRKEKHDVIATATALTARSITEAIKKFVLPLENSSATERGGFRELIASGGGTKNASLMRMIAEDLTELKIEVRTSDEIGLPSQAKEAVAFALLAYETWHQQPSNVPSATGAKRPAILGKISYA
jgi:anhydro-N-acetylmuramic acid kinase